jgi:hypothetical protein|tara:strand:- start:25 stop:252 length:228 start_codon:yes stop_codon:yes gene_type:complete
MEAEKIFNYSTHPFECRSFSITMDMGIKQTKIKKVFFYFGIKPVIIIMSTSTDYSISIEFQIWKLSFTLSSRLWS